MRNLIVVVGLVALSACGAVDPGSLGSRPTPVTVAGLGTDRVEEPDAPVDTTSTTATGGAADRGMDTGDLKESLADLHRLLDELDAAMSDLDASLEQGEE